MNKLTDYSFADLKAMKDVAQEKSIVTLMPESEEYNSLAKYIQLEMSERIDKLLAYLNEH